jgi:hypothetical protein
MSVFAPRALVSVALLAALALLSTSCSTTVAAKAGSPDYYWTAARNTYAAGDYAKAVENLDRLLDNPEYASRAIPWSLVLTAGMAAGYAELAADYAKGAHAGGANDAAFHRKAAEYRDLANPLVLAATRVVDKLAQQPAGSITLAFGRPRGSLAPPPVLYHIAAGLPVTPADAEAAPAIALERSVLLSACAAVGAPDDSAKASEILSHASTITPRATFAKAMADMLERAATVYSRDQLDYPDKLAMATGRVRALRDVAADPGPPMVIRVKGQ